MKFKRQAQQIENFLEEEFSKKVPLLVLPNNNIVYKKFKIKKNKLGQWELRDAANDLVNTFRLRVTAALAAKYYDNIDFRKYNEIKSIDTQYWNSAVDAGVFKYRYDHASDQDKRDLYRSRWEITNQRAKFFRDEITRKFKTSF